MARNKDKVVPNLIVYTESEADDNKYIAELMLVFLIIFYILFMLNEFDFFLVDKFVMRIAFITNFVCAILITFLALIPSVSSKPATKYIVLSLCSLFTIVLMTSLNFHAVVAMSVPMIVALNYHSRRLSYLALAETIICAGVSPVLGIFFNTWEPDFFASLIYAADPNLELGELVRYIPVQLHGFDRYGISFAFVALPQVFYGLMLGVAIIITNKRKRKQYYGQIANIKQSRNRVLEAIANIVENRDFTTGDHVKRTTQTVSLMMGVLKEDPLYKDILTNDYCESVTTTALMHDLGKIAVPDSILNKEGELTPEEMEIFKTHTKKSYELVNNILEGLNDDEFKSVAGNIALYHHERFDGSGYPEGLVGEKIPLEARIMAIADAYDELVAEGYSRETVSHEKAYEMMREAMGSKFDPELWSAFAKSYRKIVEAYLK